MCSRHEARHMPRLRLAPPCSRARSRVAVAELGVVRRLRAHCMNRLLASLFAPLCFLAGCNTVQPPSRAPQGTCSLDLQSEFRYERVIVFADHLRAFSGIVTTEPSIGLAKHLSIPTHSSRLELRIEAPASGSVFAGTVNLQRGRYLGLSREFRTRKFTLEQQATNFLYD